MGVKEIAPHTTRRSPNPWFLSVADPPEGFEMSFPIAYLVPPGEGHQDTRRRILEGRRPSHREMTSKILPEWFFMRCMI